MMVSGTPGTGTITLGTAVTDATNGDFQTFAGAGVVNGNSVSYTIVDGHNWEVGRGTYTAAGTTLSRGPLSSSAGGAAITATSAAIVFISALAEDLALLAPLASPTFSGTVTGPDGGTWTSTALAAGSATTWQAPVGSVLAAGAPGLAFVGITNTGFAASSAAGGNLAFWQAGNIELNLSTNAYRIRQGSTYGWSSATNNNAPSDAGISRTGAAAIAVGNGTQGDTTGTVACATLSGNSGSVSVPLGTVTAGGGPGLNFIGIPTTGLAANSAGGGNLAVWQGGNIELNLSANSFRIRRDATYGWASATNNNAPPDLFMSRQAAATLHLGAADAASPVAQTFGVQGVVAGNGNTAGATWTIQGSLSNGSGGGDVNFNTTLSNAASGVQNTGALALRLKGGTQLVYTNSATQILGTLTTITGGGTAQAPTLTAGPVAGNPTKWLPYDDNGTTRYIPSW